MVCFTCRANPREIGSSYCRPCLNTRQRGYLERNRAKVNAAKRIYNKSLPGREYYKKRYAASSQEYKLGICRKNFRNRIWRDFKMTVQDYANLWLQQNFACGICSLVSHDLDLDHDHLTGLPRGLLCTVCNTRLAIMEDNIYAFRASRYLSLYKPTALHQGSQKSSGTGV